ncbi:MAG: mucin desulfatase, partial [Luteolibacter sp.]
MHDLRAISALFQMRADFVAAQAFGSGHINDTYCASYDHAGVGIRYIHQRLNHHVFKDPVRVMENVARVTRHALEKLHAEG